MYDLTGKVAVVTGAGGERGIGRAIAERLAREGADVAVSDVVDEPHEAWGGLTAVKEGIEKGGRRSIAVTADVTDSGQVEVMFDRVVGELGRVDILVNNAGALAGKDRVPVVELEEALWDHVMTVNTKGTFLCSKVVAKLMIERGDGGRIINMSSVSGKKGSPRFAAYSASKFAVIGFTQSLSGELAPHGIRVNAICPGLIETERLSGMASGLKPEGTLTEEYREQMIERVSSLTPLGRIGTGEDVAKMAAFLASEESEYLTGLAVTVAGGSWMM